MSLDGAPHLDKSDSARNYKGYSTSKYLMKFDDDDGNVSSISDMFEQQDIDKFRKVYN